MCCTYVPFRDMHVAERHTRAACSRASISSCSSWHALCRSAALRGPVKVMAMSPALQKGHWQGSPDRLSTCADSVEEHHQHITLVH